jgi:hypothetical protein
MIVDGVLVSVVIDCALSTARLKRPSAYNVRFMLDLEIWTRQLRTSDSVSLQLSCAFFLF